MKKLTEKKRRDLEAFEALPPSIREYLLAYAAGMVAGACTRIDRPTRTLTRRTNSWRSNPLSPST